MSKVRVVISTEALVGSIISIAWIWLCWRYWNFYPLWDAAIYYEEALAAAKTTLDPRAYNIAGHPTMGYLWLPGVLTRFFGESYRVFLVYNAVLAWLMSIAVVDMAMRILRGEGRVFELLLVAGSIMFCPVLVASVLQLTPDFGVVAFLTLSARAFMRERHWRGLAWGILACLSKESGVLLFAVQFAIYVVVFGLRIQGTARQKIAALRRMSPVLGLPAAVMFGWLLLRAPKGEASLWAGVEVWSVVRQFVTVSFLDNVLPASLATILVLNCMWIPVLLVMLALGYWFVCKIVLALPVAVSRNPAFEFAVLTCVLDLYLLTRFRTFTNVRYYLPVFPWIILLAARGILSFGLPRVLFLIAQGITLLALGTSNFRSFDPVSADTFGTMKFGDRRLFHITSLTGECCGLGRDQLVYNLEFAQMDRLLRQILPFVLSSKEHAVAVHPEADWKVFDSIDPATLLRDTPRRGSFKAPFTHTWAVAAAPVKPEKIYFVALPNMPNSSELNRYAAWYKFHWRRRRFSSDGYRIDVHELTLKH